MKTHFISLSPNAPDGFEFRKLAKRDLLSGQIALYTESLTNCTDLLDDFFERVAGLVITEGHPFSYTALGPHLWHLQITPDVRLNLLTMASFFLDQTLVTDTLQEKSDYLEIELKRCQRDYQQARSEYGSHARILGNKVQDLRKEIQLRKDTEKQLNIFKTFAESSLQGMGWVAKDGNAAFFNPALNRLFGSSSDEPLSKTSVLAYYTEEDRIRLKSEIIPQIIREGVWTGELMICQKGTNERIPTLNSCFLINGGDGDPAHIGNIITDLRDQKKTEQELFKVKKLESLGVLAGGIAHDFNNLLSAILGNIDLAKMSMGPADESQHLLEEAKQASIRAKHLAQQLLTFSRGGEPIRQKASIGSIIMESASFVLHGSHVVCQYDIPADLWTVEADSGQLSQVIQNLILNAGQSMPEGGEIRVACENVTTKNAELPTQKKQVKITVSDNGCGISPEYIDKIFDPYFSTKEEGSGLGLAICHSIITKHGGRISVNSKVGRGTTFTILLAGLSESIERPNIPATTEPERESNQLRILVMDDEPMLLTIAERALVQLGHEAFVAKDGQEAIDLYEEQLKNNKAIDITIMDLTIPGGMGGKDAVKELQKIDPSAVVIVSSGYSGDPVMANYREYGFSAAIAKPFEISELCELIEVVSKK